MSITKLQQARQMYAMGQRVKRIAFGGGGSQDHVGGGGYQGGGGEHTGGGKGSQAGGAGTGTDGQGGTGGGSREDKNPFNTGPVTTVTPMDVKEQYRLGVKAPPVGTPLYNQPDFSRVGPGSTQGNNRIDALNLQGANFKPINIPVGVPGGVLLNTVGNFIGGMGFNKNKNFFAENVAGKYGYGYGLKDFEKYMSDRMAGEVGAYGNVEQGQNALNGREGEGGGIMDVYNNTNNTDDDVDGDGDVDQTDDFIFRYFDKTGETLQAGAGGVEDLMTRIRQRINDIFTT